MNPKVPILSVVEGVVPLLTGLIPNTPPTLASATHHGHPVAWLVRLLLSSQHFPQRINVPNLIVHIAIWIIIVGMIIGVLTRARKPE